MVTGYALAATGVAISITGMVFPWFAGGGLPPPGFTGRRFFSALETQDGRALFAAAAVAWAAVFGSYLARPSWRGRLVSGGMYVLFVLAAVVFAFAVGCPLDAPCPLFGAWVANLGFLLSGFGALSLARLFRAARASPAS